MIRSIVCVIDGDPAVRDSLQTLMSLNGHEVATYATGGAFLKAMCPLEIKCVVCEADLPDTTGFAIFEALREQNSDTPFALLVSHANRRTYNRAHRSGIAHVFAKPLANPQLTTFVSGGFE